jgi:hypothetical protein
VQVAMGTAEALIFASMVKSGLATLIMVIGRKLAPTTTSGYSVMITSMWVNFTSGME